MAAHRGLLTLMLAVLLVAPSSAQSANLHAQEAEVHGGGTFKANLVGVVLARTNATIFLELVVQQGRLTIYEQTSDVSSGLVAATPWRQTSTTDILENATISDFSARPNARIFAMADEAQVLADDANGLSIRPTDGMTMVFEPRASTEPARTIATAGRLAVTAARDGTFRAHGSMTLAVWDTSFILHNETGDHPIDTGVSTEPIGSPNSPVFTKVQREAVVEITNGTFVFAQQTFEALVANTELDLETGALILHEPKGINPVDDTILSGEARSLELNAPFTANLIGSANTVALSFPVPPSDASLDGVAVRHPGSDSTLWPMILFALLLVPAWAAMYGGSHWRRRLRTLNELVVQRRFGEALISARAIRRIRRRQPDALVAEAMGLLHAQDYVAAARTLESKGWTVALGPLRDYLRAVAAAGQGKGREARHFVGRCLADAPDMLPEVLANPLLVDLAPNSQQTGGRTNGALRRAA